MSREEVRNSPIAFTSVVTSIIRGQDALTKVLLARTGVDVNLDGIAGNTALMFATRWKQEAIVQHLLESGADHTKVNDKGETALFIARKSGNRTIVKMLREFGATM